MRKINKRVLVLSLLSIIIICISISLTLINVNVINPPLWKISKGNKEIIAILTIENISKEKSRLGYKTKKLINSTDYLLVVEDVVKGSTYSMKETRRPFKNTKVKDILSEEEKVKLNNICDILDISYEDIVQKDPDEVMNIILAYQANKVHLGDQENLSSIITEDFYNRNKLVYGCETYEEKMRLLNSYRDYIIQNNYNNVEYDEFKKLVNSEFNENLKGFEEWYNNKQEAYIRGDVDKLEKGIRFSKLKDSRYDEALKNRNLSIYEKVIEKSQVNEGSPLLAFEVNILLGEEGILKLFSEDGYKIERIN